MQRDVKVNFDKEEREKRTQQIVNRKWRKRGKRKGAEG